MPDRPNLKQFGQLMADGSRHRGFATPSLEPDDMGLIQPQIFAPSGKRYAFWLGAFPRQEQTNGFYTDFAKGTSLSFSRCLQLSSGTNEGILFRSHPRIYGD
jgi:hypothetical protein